MVNSPLKFMEIHANKFLTKEIYDDVISPRYILSESGKACEHVSGIGRNS